jgi:hypothetical protein
VAFDYRKRQGGQHSISICRPFGEPSHSRQRRKGIVHN